MVTVSGLLAAALGRPRTSETEESLRAIDEAQSLPESAGELRRVIRKNHGATVVRLLCAHAKGGGVWRLACKLTAPGVAPEDVYADAYVTVAEHVAAWNARMKEAS